MELQQVANLLNGRFLIINKKKDKNDFLRGKLLTTCSVDSLGLSKQEVVYYDTPELFFAEHGINIYTILSGKQKELIIKYDSDQIRRIEFLKNIPNYFKVPLKNKHEGINGNYELITEAIYQVFPEGLHVDIETMLRNSKPQVIINKKCESYRVVNNNGLKTTISFTECAFTRTNIRQKFIQDYLEITAEANISKELFEGFMRSIILDCPNFIKTNNNEMRIATENLR